MDAEGQQVQMVFVSERRVPTHNVAHRFPPHWLLDLLSSSRVFFLLLILASTISYVLVLYSFEFRRMSGEYIAAYNFVQVFDRADGMMMFPLASVLESGTTFSK